MELASDHSAEFWMHVERGPIRGCELLVRQPLDRRSVAVRDGAFESFVEAALRSVPNIEGAAIWDVGAHQGYHTLAFAAIVGAAGTVVAFEPNEHNLPYLRANLERNAELGRRVQVIGCALAATDGTAEFSQGPDSGWDSAGGHLVGVLAPEEPSAYVQFARATVETARGDTLVAAGQVPPPAAVKVDVEGAEDHVLSGLQRVLRISKPLLLIEVHTITAMLDVQRRLHRLGYDIALLAPEQATRSRCFVVAAPVEPSPRNRRGQPNGWRRVFSR